VTAEGWSGGWYIVPWQVIFRDLDAFGHVNNATFFTFFEWGRARLWFSLTGGGVARDVGFIVARAECDFKQQVALEPIEIRTRIGEIGNTSLEFLSEIRRDNGEQIAASGRVVVVLYDWERQQKIPVSDEFRQKVRGVTN
jgi:acyl-CoA thioester hydrolase